MFAKLIFIYIYIFFFLVCLSMSHVYQSSFLLPFSFEIFVVKPTRTHFL